MNHSIHMFLYSKQAGFVLFTWESLRWELSKEGFPLKLPLQDFLGYFFWNK